MQTINVFFFFLALFFIVSTIKMDTRSQRLREDTRAFVDGEFFIHQCRLCRVVSFDARSNSYSCEGFSMHQGIYLRDGDAIVAIPARAVSLKDVRLPYVRRSAIETVWSFPLYSSNPFVVVVVDEGLELDLWDRIPCESFSNDLLCAALDVQRLCAKVKDKPCPRLCGKHFKRVASTRRLRRFLKGVWGDGITIIYPKFVPCARLPFKRKLPKLRGPLAPCWAFKAQSTAFQAEMRGFDNVFGVGARTPTIRQDAQRVAVITNARFVISRNYLYFTYDYLRYERRAILSSDGDIVEVKVVAIN